jgi:hypothetical protein
MSGNQVDCGTDLEPVPVEGCHTCAAQAISREDARAVQLPEQVARCNAQISNHPHVSVGDGRRLAVVSVWGVAQ